MNCYYIIQNDSKNEYQKTLWLATTEEDVLLVACQHLMNGARQDMLEDFRVIEIIDGEEDGHPVEPFYFYCARKHIVPKCQISTAYGIECKPRGLVYTDTDSI